MCFIMRTGHCSEKLNWWLDMYDPDDWDWLEEFPLFEEIQSLTSLEDNKPQLQVKIQDFSPIPNQGQVYVHENWLGSTLRKQAPDVFETTHENSLNIHDILSNDSILYIDAYSYSPVSESESFKGGQHSSGESDEEKFPQTETKCQNETLDLAMVDEIIKTTVESDQWESDSSRSEISSDMTSEPSPKMTDEDYNDPEWRPEEPLKALVHRKHQGRRTTPYLRGSSQEDKKLRKKEQNKNAATRYRQKKKQEVSEILKEEEELKGKKEKLEAKVADIQNEIKYLKGLMRDLFRAKGMIK